MVSRPDFQIMAQLTTNQGNAMSRRNLYGKAQIIVGDRTTHEGIVLSGSRTSNWHEIPIARKGDAVWCPTCIPHVFEIAEGLENCKDQELPMATEGHRTTCGAMLIAQTSSINLDHATRLANSISTNPSFDEQTNLRHEDVAGLPYLIKTKDGREYSGRVEHSEHLPRIFTGGVDSYEVFWGDEALANKKDEE